MLVFCSVEYIFVVFLPNFGNWRVFGAPSDVFLSPQYAFGDLLNVFPWIQHVLGLSLTQF